MKDKIVNWFKTVVSDFNSSHCAMHAAGLTYFAMLSLVPLLCVLLSVAKLCGADDFAREQINARIDAMITNVERAQDDDLAKVVSPTSEEERERKRIVATPTGKALIDIIHEELLKSPELTGIWEKKLRDIEARKYDAATFINELKQQITDIVNQVLSDNSNRKLL